ncbi:MAG TPA: hypothetical protein PK331_09280 [Gordonia sp. (in: high G+C Gram-positive bacteria)]|uniref:hypothetical protein n=1 Tax=unclassified Gordonia (in: high G+C Gram-positive bacteria) TaxID=2657482 RepID=UPI000FB8A780|nr:MULTISPECIES: hypothetical protein [unclassified Gordonia (in: high G+C Gram-positive bacteria)]RUP40674.1 MAG: hypothetical protein EKK60_03415 [Gordonia sp. (in: high G+C Gram-positive bacteria)]HNP57518.1 hypothetical protein [Gordonia sp. (in: high G+C Gram-positive bacteria)]HRC51097.1 hypothetical protein [Gordonia sp. (in: high G+C Gram-positive bacteria)]
MQPQHIVRTPLGNPVESVLGYLNSRHPAARQNGRFAEVLVELPDGTFTFEVLPVSALSIEVTR